MGVSGKGKSRHASMECQVSRPLEQPVFSSKSNAC